MFPSQRYQTPIAPGEPQKGRQKVPKSSSFFATASNQYMALSLSQSYQYTRKSFVLFVRARRLSITQPTLLSRLAEPLKFFVVRPVCFCDPLAVGVNFFFVFYKAKAAIARAITLPAMNLDGEPAAAPSNWGRVLLLETAPVVAAAMPAVALAAPVVVG